MSLAPRTTKLPTSAQQQDVFIAISHLAIFARVQRSYQSFYFKLLVDRFSTDSKQPALATIKSFRRLLSRICCDKSLRMEYLSAISINVGSLALPSTND